MMPYAKPGFWSIEVDPSRLLNAASARLDYVNASMVGLEHDGSFIPCTSFSDATESCPGGNQAVTARCGVAFSGVSCSKCADQHWRFFGQCKACHNLSLSEGVGQMWNVVVLGCIVTFWAILNQFLCEELNTLDTFLAFSQVVCFATAGGRSLTKALSLQMVSIISEFEAAWPTTLKSQVCCESQLRGVT